MATRNQVKSRRDMNRLHDLVQQHKHEKPPLAAIEARVASSTSLVNSTWQAFQKAAVASKKEVGEREAKVAQLRGWISRWRPVVLLAVPGAQGNIRALPPAKSTPDDIVRVGTDMKLFIEQNPATASFRVAALRDLGTLIDDTKREITEASRAVPEALDARDAHTEAIISGNEVLIRGLEIVRAVFGAKSREYKQFIERDAGEKDDREVEEEVLVGEEE